MNKLFELHQKITLMVNEYIVFKEAADGSQHVAAFAKQKRLALREQFTLFADETQSQAIASSAARSVLDFGAIYDIMSADGKYLASLKKEFKQSLLNSTWHIFADQQTTQPLFVMKEKSQFVAIFRRLWGFLPYANDIPFPVKYHFVIKSGEAVVGEYVKNTRFRDHYSMFMDEAAAGKLDERVWMVAAVLLDAMQSR